MSLDLNVNKIVSEVLGENTVEETLNENSENVEMENQEENVTETVDESPLSETMFNNALNTSIAAGFGALHTVNQIRYTRNNK